MFVGPVFGREAVIVPRRPRLYVLRGVYATALFILMCTAWLIVAGTQVISTVGDMARFGAILFQILAPLQLTLILFLAAIQTAAAVAQEKDRKTFVLLLLTRMSNSELVLGRLFASLLQVTVLLAVSLPILTAVTLFGGVSLPQVFWVAAITAASAMAAGSLGSTIALWREKTFQTLASTIILIVGWIGLWEVVGNRLDAMGEPSSWVTCFSPARAVAFATRPMLGSLFPMELVGFVTFGLGTSLVLNAIAIARVRVWNPGREVRPRMEEAESSEEAAVSNTAAVHRAPGASRPVWHNPVLWREMRTWAYGRKIVVVRVAYTLISMAIVAGVLMSSGGSGIAVDEGAASIPPVAQTLGPFLLASLVLINALAVTAITNERDVKALDLLLVTDLSPKEFLFGKLAGVLYVTRDMVIWPAIASIAAWWSDAIELVPLIYLLLGLVVMNVFVAMLGIHCGSTYVSSRQAVAVSLGSVFFLFLGVLTCLYMMVSFGSFQGQLTPFLAFIVGGGVGLYVAWGRENPSPAILLTAGVLPLAMFFVITSFLLGRTTSVFLVMTATYGFATTAMMMPALGEYMVAMGRVRLQEDE